MKKLFLFVILFTVHFGFSQSFEATLSHKYIYPKQWDKIIQTYNFARPNLTEKQPLFKHGAQISFNYLLKSEKRIMHGINFSYSYFRSSAENENFNNTLNLHFLNLGYIIRYENDKKLKGLYTDLIISATSSVLFRNVNGEPFEYDEKTAKAFGIGGDLSIRTGYYLKLKNKIHLSPFILVGYTPFIYSPNCEAIINQTKGLVSNNWTGIVSTQIGLIFHVRQQKKD